MSIWEKLIARIRNNPKTVSFDEVEKILLRFGYCRRQPGSGSSHYIFRKQGCPIITIPKNEPYVKEMYVKLVIEALAMLEK